MAAGRADQCTDPLLRKKGRRTKKHGLSLSCDNPPGANDIGTPVKRQRTEEPCAAKVGGTSSPVLSAKPVGTSSSFSPPISPILPSPLPNSHFYTSHTQQTHTTGHPSIESSSSQNSPMRFDGHSTIPRAYTTNGVGLAPTSILSSSAPSMEQVHLTSGCTPLPGIQPNTGMIKQSHEPAPSLTTSLQSFPALGRPQPLPASTRLDDLDACIGGSNLMQLEPMLSTFMKELREFKATSEQMAHEFRSTTEDLRKEILMLHQSQQKMEKRLDALTQVVTTVSGTPIPTSPSTSSASEAGSYSPSVFFTNGNSSFDACMSFQSQIPFASFSSSPAQLPIPSSPGFSHTSRSEILSYLPFLSPYNLESPDIPFVVDSLR